MPCPSSFTCSLTWTRSKERTKHFVIVLGCPVALHSLLDVISFVCVCVICMCGLKLAMKPPRKEGKLCSISKVPCLVTVVVIKCFSFWLR